MRGRTKFKKYKKVILFFVRFISFLPRNLRIYLYKKQIPKVGYLGFVLRYIFIKTLAQSIGDNVSIHPYVHIFNFQNLFIGNNVSIHPMSYLDALGVIQIGNDVSIAHSVTILSFNHRYNDLEIPIKDQGLDCLETVINDNVWIGAKASILAGVTVNSGSIIAAGSVVTKDVASNIIIAGIPAKKLKDRCK